MARLVTAPNETISIQMGRIEFPRPQVDTAKITVTQTVTVQVEPQGNDEERRDSVAVQETEPPAEPTASRVIIY